MGLEALEPQDQGKTYGTEWHYEIHFVGQPGHVHKAT